MWKKVKITAPYCALNVQILLLIMSSVFTRCENANRGNFLDFVLCSVSNTASSAAPQIPLYRRMLGANQELLRLRHWQSDALITRQDLIHVVVKMFPFLFLWKAAFPKRRLSSHICAAVQGSRLWSVIYMALVSLGSPLPNASQYLITIGCKTQV